MGQGSGECNGNREYIGVDIIRFRFMGGSCRSMRGNTVEHVFQNVDQLPYL